MGLFGKKKSKLPPPETGPVRSAKPVKPEAPAEFESASMKKVSDLSPDSFAAPKIFNGPRGINPKVLEKSMEQLAVELKERDEREPQHYMIEGISEKAMDAAGSRFEDTVKEIRDKESKVVYGRIAAADESDIEEKVQALSEQYDYLTSEDGEEIDYGFGVISEEEFRSKLEAFDMERAAKRQDIINSMPGLTSAQKEKIKEFFDEDVMAKPIDYVNSIPELKQKDLDEIRKKLERIYAQEREKDPKIKMESADQ